MNNEAKREIINKLREIRELAEKNNIAIYIEDAYAYEGIMLPKEGGELEDYDITIEYEDDSGKVISREQLEIEEAERLICFV